MKLIIIGSSPDAHIKFASPYVSGYHAELLLLDNGDIMLTDKASLNGTFVNGQKIEPNKEVSVRRGDTIGFANMTLNWESVPPSEDLKGIKEIRGIGTNYLNKYMLKGDKVSRFHATLKLKQDKKWYICDHSKNGTTVNGVPIQPDQDIQLKKSDKIICGGTECPNPYTGKAGKGGKGGSKGGVDIPWRRWVFGSIGVIALISGIIFLFKRSGNTPMPQPAQTLKEMTDAELYSKYKSSAVLLVGYYHYKVSAGSLDLERSDYPTEVVMTSTGRVVPATGSNAKMNLYTGTGFFVSEDGKIVTNLHIASPWLFNNESAQIADIYRTLLIKDSNETGSPIYANYAQQVKVEGVVTLYYIANGDYFDSENLKSVRVIATSNDTSADVAVLQAVTRKLPEGATIVSVDDFVTDDNDIKVGEHIYTMGFPLGLSAQDLESQNGIQLLARGGNITKECGEYDFGFDAASYGGASGSPIFNNKGQLVGILNAGFTQSQGFNFGIKAVYAKDLIEQKTKH